jgi:hypothetical protein
MPPHKNRAAVARKRNMEDMQMAVLFWCYKEPEVCRERLERLRRHDPKLPVYVLFGGEPDQAPEFEKVLHGLHDDFWVYDVEPAPGEIPDEVREPAGGKRWKWYHGDLLLLEWYLKRGVNLEWDTLFVMQWDMLVFAPLSRILPDLRKNEIYFSGLRPVSEIEEQWTWTSAERHPEFRADYLAFISHLKNHFGHAAPPLCCLAILMALPRVFFEKFAQVPQPALGFIEYKLPTYADLFGIRLNTSIDHQVWWDDHQPYSWTVTLSAIPVEIKPITMAMNRLLPGGARIFHPYMRTLPPTKRGWARLIAGSSYRDVRRWCRRQLKAAFR